MPNHLGLCALQTARWAEEFIFSAAHLSAERAASGSVDVRVFDKRSWGDDVLIGGCKMHLAELDRLDGQPAVWHTLAGLSGGAVGELCLALVTERSGGSGGGGGGATDAV